MSDSAAPISLDDAEHDLRQFLRIFASAQRAYDAVLTAQAAQRDLAAVRSEIGKQEERLASLRGQIANEAHQAQAKALEQRQRREHDNALLDAQITEKRQTLAGLREEAAQLDKDRAASVEAHRKALSALLAEKQELDKVVKAARAAVEKLPVTV